MEKISVITLVNQEYLIRFTENSEKPRLIGAGTLKREIGEELSGRIFKRVLCALSQNTIVKLRRGLRIEFIRK